MAWTEAVKKAAAMFGLKGLEDPTKVLGYIDKVLDDKFSYRRPRKSPRLFGLSAFTEVKYKTIAGHQYVLEQGMFKGSFWRIRVKTHPWVAAFYVWDRYSPTQAEDQWDQFITLVQAKHDLEAALRQSPKGK